MYVQILYHTTLYFYNKCIGFLALHAISNCLPLFSHVRVKIYK